MQEVPAPLAEARAAHARGEWDLAYRAYRAAADGRQLPAEDLSALGDAAWWLGLVREAMTTCEQVHQRLLAEGRPARAAMAAMDVGFTALLRGELAVGSGWLARARRLLADLPESVEHGYLRLVDIESLSASGDHAGTIEAARDLQGFAARFGDATLQTMALVAEGMATVRRGQLAAGQALLDEAMLSVVGGSVRPDFAGNIYCQMMALCHDVADVGRAREWTEATMRWCAGFPSAVMFVGICRVHRAQLLVLAGDWDRATAEAERCCTELAELNVAVVGEAHHQLGEIHRVRGDLLAAERAYRACVERGRDPLPGLALLRLAQGRPAEGLAAVEAALRAEPIDPFRRARLLAAQVDLALAVGAVAVAHDAAAALASTAEVWPTAGFTAMAAQARGVVALAGGDPAAALPLLRAAANGWQRLDAAHACAVARLLVADACAALGDDGTAALERDLAAGTFQRLGVPQPSMPARPRSRPTPGGLTPREAEVLAHVARGLTNKQVAAALVISEKTVARHLANIFTKLDLSTRTAAAAWAHANGVTPGAPVPPA